MQDRCNMLCSSIHDNRSARTLKSFGADLSPNGKQVSMYPISLIKYDGPLGGRVINKRHF